MKITDNQQKIINLLMQDLTCKEVAVKLQINPTNVSTTLSTMRKNWRIRTNYGLLLKIQQNNINNNLNKV